MTMYAGGPGGDPNGLLAMAPPQSAGGLLQAPQTAWSQYPLTSGLLSSMAKNMGGTQGGSNSQLAYQMAGSPQMGPFASVTAPTAIPGSLDASGSSSSGGGSGASGLATGLLGTIAKNPKAVSQIYGLLGGGAPSLASFGTGAAANAALAAAGIGTPAGIAAATAADSASIAAANSAWLAAQPAATSAAAAAAAPAATAAAPAASGTGAGSALGTVAPWAAGALALAAPFYGMSTAPVQLGTKYFDTLKQGLAQTPGTPGYQNAALELAATMSTRGEQVPKEIRDLATSLGIQPLSQSLVDKSAAPPTQAWLQNTFGKYAKQN